MPGFDELLVGYAERDPLLETISVGDRRASYGGNCLSCGRPVFFNPSAFPILSGSDHDPRVVCRLCDMLHGPEIEQAMVTRR